MADGSDIGQALAKLRAGLDAAMGPKTPVAMPDDVQVSLEALRAGLEAANAKPRSFADILKGWNPFKHPRHQKGTPDGGKFKGDSDSMSSLLGFSSKPKAKLTTSSLDWWESDPKYKTYSNGKSLPEPKVPASAVPHPAVDNHGDPVLIHYPTKPSPNAVWNDAEAEVTFTPLGEAPGSLNGISTALAYPAPKTDAEWLNVPGQNPDVELGMPPLTAPKGQHIGAGVLIEEPDGRVWLVSPTNRFGGYHQTFPKGTYEDGIASLQANAIKEAYEESGLQIEITGMLGDFKRTTSVARFYTAKRIGGSPALMGWESQAVRLVPLSKARKWLNRKDVDHPVLEAYEALRGIDVDKAFDEGKHDRWPKGSPLGGQFKDSGNAPPKIGWKKDGSGPGANATYYNQMKAAFEAAMKGNYGPAQKLVDNYASFAQKFEIGAKQNSHGKWKAQVHQYAASLVGEGKMLKDTAQTASVVEGNLGAQKISLWKKVGGKPGGTAPGDLYTDELGQKWLVKGNKMKVEGKVDAATSDERARNEVLASKLMEASGIPAPTYKLVDLGDEYGGGLGVATKWEEGLKPVSSKAQRMAAQDQFAVHAWLGNWDAWGATGDNMLVRPDGSIVNIDPGGSLLFRAQGLPKAKGAFGPDAADWDSMRSMDPGKAIFGDMKQYQLDASREHLTGLSSDKITALVKAHGPGNEAQKSALAADLIARKNAIMLKPASKATKIVPSPAEYAAMVEDLKPSIKAGSDIKPLGMIPNGAAAKAVQGVMGGVAFMAAPNFSLSSAMPPITNAWIQNAQNAGSLAEAQDALKAAAYFKALGDFHSGKTDITPDDYYKTLADVYEVPLGEAVPASPAVSGGAFSMAQAEDYRKGAMAAVKAGQEPAPPVFSEGDDNAYGGDIKIIAAWAKDPTKAPDGSMDDLKNGTFYVPKDKPSAPQIAALTAYGQAMVAHYAPTKTAGPIVSSFEDAELYAGAAMQAAASGKLPKPPTFAEGSIHANDAGIMANWASSPGFAADKATMKAGTVYGKDGGPKFETKALTGYGQALMEYYGSKAPQVREQKPAPAVLPAMPDFDGSKLDASNANAGSHNKKVDLIKALAESKNSDGILALNYGTNTYGKKQAALANNALAALGSSETVAVGQKAGEHPAISGQQMPDMSKEQKAVAPKTIKITAADLPKKPDFANFNGTGKGLSSKAWKNEQNQNLVDQVYDKAMTGDLVGLQGLKAEVLNEDGTTTGQFAPFSNHKSKYVQTYWSDAVDAVHDKLNPPEPIVPATTLKNATLAKAAAHFKPIELLRPTSKVPANMQVGFWMALGQMEGDPANFMPQNIKKVDSALTSKLQGDYGKTSALSKKFMRQVQSSSAINNAYRAGDTQFVGTQGTFDLAAVAKQAKADSSELPEGTEFYKWINITPAMIDDLKGAKAGLVMQNPGSMCNSTNATSTSNFGEHRLVLRAAKGARVLPSFGSGAYSTEYELTTLPGARMVLNKITKVGSRYEVEVTLLPPHENDHIPKGAKALGKL